MCVCVLTPCVPPFFLPRRRTKAHIICFLCHCPISLHHIGACSQPGPLCGAVRARDDWRVTPGHQVAALVPRHTGSEWILASVVRATPDGSLYVVEDIVEESDATMSQAPAKKERWAVPYAVVVPLPRWACTPGIPGTFFPSGSRVLALYPQTTCFYPAVVHEPPTHDHPTVYKMHFFDDDFPDGRVQYQDVPIRFVVRDPNATVS